MAGLGCAGQSGAWPMAIAKRRAIDRFRREELGERKRDGFGREELNWTRRWGSTQLQPKYPCPQIAFCGHGNIGLGQNTC